MNQTVLYQKLNFLNSLDLISKYTLKSIFLIPKCKKITIEIEYQQTIKKLISQYIIFFFCFFMFSQKPKLIYNIEKNKKIKIENFTLQQKINAIFLVTLQKREFFCFLHNIFLRNWKLLQICESYSLDSSYISKKNLIVGELKLSSKLFFFR